MNLLTSSLSTSFSVPSSPSWAQEAQCKYVDNKKYAHSPKEFYSRASSSIGYK